MKLLECLETEAFNELIAFSLEEVKWVFDHHIYFVPDDQENKVIDEATNIEKLYKEGLERINNHLILAIYPLLCGQATLIHGIGDIQEFVDRFEEARICAHMADSLK